MLTVLFFNVDILWTGLPSNLSKINDKKNQICVYNIL